ncbi:MAG TPA: STAS domain-containing protein [Pirellula sp.]|nr:STAS domain-containing protein [Pirellula sp.]
MDIPQFRVWTQGDVTIASVTGDKGKPLAESSGLKGLVAQGVKKLVIDLTGARFLGSYVLGHLIVVHKLVREAGSSVRLNCPDQEILDVFRITKLDSIFQVFTKLDDAIASF